MVFEKNPPPAQHRWNCMPHGQRKPNSQRQIQLGRAMFVGTIALFAMMLGFSFYLLAQAEKKLALSQFESIAGRALAAAAHINARQLQGLVTLSSIIGHANPKKEQWPFAYLDGFETISRNIVGISGGRSMGWGPILDPKQAPEYEEFAYDYYDNVREPPFPNGTATQWFGRGIWGTDWKAVDPCKRAYHDTTGETAYGSPHNFMVPVLQHSAGIVPVLMVNFHLDPVRGSQIDKVYECVNSDSNGESKPCSTITDFVNLPLEGVFESPSAIIFSPVYPAHDPDQLVGIVGSTIIWSSIFEDAFSENVNGIDCVISTDDTAYTYRVTDGVAMLVGEGDLHQREYDIYQRSTNLNPDGLFGPAAANYKLTLYPSETLYAEYSIHDPVASGIGVTCFIIFLLLCFFLYDYFVRQEFTAKQDLLEAKRKFVRFVSHEVRTPLNAVCMGLSLLQDEIGTETGVGVDGKMKSGGMPFSGSFKSETSDEDARSDDDESFLWVEGDHATSHGSLPRLSEENVTTTIARSSAKEWMKLVADAMENAQSSVDVLNDVLNYDKIEMNNLTLELTVVPVWRLIASTAAEFQVSAAKKKISFRMRYRSEFDEEENAEIRDNHNGQGDKDVRNSRKALSSFPSFDVGDGTSKLESMELGQYNRRSSEANRDLMGDGKMLDRKVIGDSIRVQQVLRNLMSNALKFTPAGGDVRVLASCIKDPPPELDKSHKSQPVNRWPRIWLRDRGDSVDNPTAASSSSNASASCSVPAETQFEMHDGTTASFAPSGYLQVSVSDTGAGMSQEQLANLFRNGIQFNVNELQAGQGSGLGLFISKGLMEQHGGSLSADSAGLGCGTTFTMTLPLYYAPDESTSGQSDTPHTMDVGVLSPCPESSSPKISNSSPLTIESTLQISPAETIHNTHEDDCTIPCSQWQRSNDSLSTSIPPCNLGTSTPNESYRDSSGFSVIDIQSQQPASQATMCPQSDKEKILSNTSPKLESKQALPTIPASPTKKSENIHRILIVDDAGTNRKLLRRLLERQGHICDDAADGQLACDKVSVALRAGWCYDTVLMDYEMPVMNGPTAVREIRKMLRSPEAKDALITRNVSTSKSKSKSGYDGDGVFMVGITGNVLNEDVRFFLNSGADAVLPKPFKMPALKELWSEHGVKPKIERR